MASDTYAAGICQGLALPDYSHDGTFGKLLLKLYTQCVNLKEKCRQLLHRNENLARQVDWLQTRLTESEGREAQMNQELSDYHLLRKHLGAQALDCALEAARQAQAAIAKEKKQKETINR